LLTRVRSESIINFNIIINTATPFFLGNYINFN